MEFFISSVEVKSESSDSDEDLLLYDGYSGKIVCVFVPELAGAHTYTLTLILTHDHLDEILVSLVFVKPVHGLLRILCQILH